MRTAASAVTQLQGPPGDREQAGPQDLAVYPGQSEPWPGPPTRLCRESLETPSFRKYFLNNVKECFTWPCESMSPRGRHSIGGSSERGPGGCDPKGRAQLCCPRPVLPASGKMHTSKSFRTFFPASRISHPKGRVGENATRPVFPVS